MFSWQYWTKYLLKLTIFFLSVEMDVTFSADPFTTDGKFHIFLQKHEI